jgi:acetyltransferase
METTIRRLNDAAEAARFLPQLVALLQDVVDGGGASVGFLRPLCREEAEDYWRNTLPDIEQGTRALLVALQGEEVAGSVQLALCPKPNGSHRAEVQKLLVFNRCRRQGIGESLMRAAEEEARREQRRLLVLDTRRGDAAEKLYEKWGYTRAGMIPGYTRDAEENRFDTVFFYRAL